MKYLAIPLLLSLSACASIFSKSNYPVSINSTPQGASFSITNRAGESVSNGTTPEVVTLKASSGYFKTESYTISLAKDGLESHSFTLSSSVDGWYFGNILLGGLIGMLIVDPASGSMYSLPDRVDVPLTEKPDSVSSEARDLSVTSIDQPKRGTKVAVG